jgi:tetraacyldisaccharide 4'-kinase
MPWYAVFLMPFSLIFRLITGARNYLFDLGVLKSHASPIPTLVVGNLSVGGTGKTPLVEFLIKHLRSEVELASLSRGYGRKTKGFIQADAHSSTVQIGDEPLQIYMKFEGEIPVFVGEDRIAALRQIQEKSPKITLVILDDAFQHRHLSPDFKILLTPYNQPFFNDYLLPSGRLRESKKGAGRADLVVVTKCPPSITEVQKSAFRTQIARVAAKPLEVFFSSIGYGKPYLVFGKYTSQVSQVILVSGLADDRFFVEFCKKEFEVLTSFSFPDHHEYTSKDADRIVIEAKKAFSQEPVILTTEKDAIKLKSLAQQGLLKEIPIFALPIQVVFEPNEQDLLLNHIREKFNIK